MTDSYELSRDYFSHLVQLVHAESYVNLCGYLHSINFNPPLPLDENRAAYGIALRYDSGCTDCHTPCTILEMLVALCHTVEQDYMHDEKYGDRTGLWFMAVLKCNGLYPYNDHNWVPDQVVRIVQEMQSGVKGFVTDPTLDIWSQMMRYLSFYINETGEYRLPEV